MGKTYESITPDLRDFLLAQRLFFVATAPLGREARINLSPKGLDTFRILDDRRVAYLDLTGSGNETSAHLEENGRITLMFCAFEGAPRIVRLYGTGRTVLPGSPVWAELSPHFDTSIPGIRQIIAVDITSASTSCGFGIPRYQFTAERDELIRSNQKRGPEGLANYQREKNARSIDGLMTTLGKGAGYQ
jgi:hypothetical protein